MIAAGLWEHFMKQVMTFLQEEDGAVTVDCVVLTAAVVTMAMFIYPMLVSPVSDMAVFVGEQITEYEDFLQ